jgi:hypothetical protein
MAVRLYAKLKHAIRFWLLRRLPNCQRTVVILSESLERPLSLRERVTVKVHLWICAWCQWYLEHLLLIRDTARAKGSESLDLSTGPGLSAEARERIKRKLADNN